MKVCVYGSTLTAWVTAACLAKAGNEVVLHEGEDTCSKELSDISVIRDELGLATEITQQINDGRFDRANDEDHCEATIHWLALEANDQRRVKYLIDVIASTKKPDTFIVNQCNFEVGATITLRNRLAEKGCEAMVIYIPDNLEQGKALQLFLQPKRMIIGIDNDKALARTKALLRPFSKQLENMQVMGTKEAEFTKFATTGMLAIRLGYINELANLADQLNVDIDVIKNGMGTDPRIGNHYLSPGCGFGGQNFQTYLSMLSDIFDEKGSRSILKTVIDENEVQKEILFRKCWQHYKGNLTGKTVAIWGVSFKPGTASIDNAPSVKVIDALLSQGVHVNVHDPEGLHNIRDRYETNSNLMCYDNMYDAINACDALMLITEWPQYMSPDFDKLLSMMKIPFIIDGRNVFDKELMDNLGFTYVGIGR
jgi:UDPglucose 6-dehydrogenase